MNITQIPELENTIVPKLIAKYPQENSTMNRPPVGGGSGLFGTMTLIDQTSRFYPSAGLNMVEEGYRKDKYLFNPVGIFTTEYDRNDAGNLLTMALNAFPSGAQNDKPLLVDKNSFQSSIPSIQWNQDHSQNAYAFFTPELHAFNYPLEYDSDYNVVYASGELPILRFTQNKNTNLTFIDSGSFKLTVTEVVYKLEWTQVEGGTSELVPTEILETNHYEHDIRPYDWVSFKSKYESEYRDKEDRLNKTKKEYTFSMSPFFQTAKPKKFDGSIATLIPSDSMTNVEYGIAYTCTFSILDTANVTSKDFFNNCKIVDSNPVAGVLTFLADFKVKTFPSYQLEAYLIEEEMKTKYKGVYNDQRMSISFNVGGSRLSFVTVGDIVYKYDPSQPIATRTTLHRSPNFLITWGANLGRARYEFARWVAKQFGLFPFDSIGAVRYETDLQNTNMISRVMLEAVDHAHEQTPLDEYYALDGVSLTYGNIEIGSASGAYNLMTYGDYLILALRDGSGYYKFNADDLLENDGGQMINGLLFDAETMSATIFYYTHGDIESDVYMAQVQFELALPQPRQLVYDFKLARYGFIGCQTRYMAKGGIISKV